tara:strand:- start:43 stop:336 length:294 start_codon:yes stop_codon:yes gene_type:complete
MAKTKKKEKIVDLKSKPEKVTQEQLKEIQALVNKINQWHSEIGRIESQKHNILHHLAVSNDEMVLLQDKMKEEYGTNDIDIYTGEINYGTNEADKKN